MNPQKSHGQCPYFGGALIASKVEIECDNFNLLLSDAAPFMISGGRTIRELYAFSAS